MRARLFLLWMTLVLYRTVEAVVAGGSPEVLRVVHCAVVAVLVVQALQWSREKAWVGVGAAYCAGFAAYYGARPAPWDERWVAMVWPAATDGLRWAIPVAIFMVAEWAARLRSSGVRADGLA